MGVAFTSQVAKVLWRAWGVLAALQIFLCSVWEPAFLEGWGQTLFLASGIVGLAAVSIPVPVEESPGPERLASPGSDDVTEESVKDSPPSTPVAARAAPIQRSPQGSILKRTGRHAGEASSVVSPPSNRRASTPPPLTRSVADNPASPEVVLDSSGGLVVSF